jgi:hypothetical protein
LTQPAKLITNVIHFLFFPKCRTYDSHKSEVQKVQRSDSDELDADLDLDQDRIEDIKADAGGRLVDAMRLFSKVLRPQLHATSPSACRRELVWKSQKNETVSLEEISRQYQSFLLKPSTELEFNRRRGRYTKKTAHRCPGYNRIEITLTPDIARSAIVSHLTPAPHEICTVCKELVNDAEIVACICGREGKSAPVRERPFFCMLTSLDNESIPTIRCSTCLK